MFKGIEAKFFIAAGRFRDLCRFRFQFAARVVFGSAQNSNASALIVAGANARRQTSPVAHEVCQGMEKSSRSHGRKIIEATVALIARNASELPVSKFASTYGLLKEARRRNLGE